MIDTPYDSESSFKVLDSRTRAGLEQEGYTCIIDSADVLLMERFSGLKECGVFSVSLDKVARVAQIVHYNTNPVLHSRTVFENFSTNFRLAHLLVLARHLRSS